MWKPHFQIDQDNRVAANDFLHLIWIFSVCWQSTITFYNDDYLYNCLDR